MAYGLTTAGGAVRITGRYGMFAPSPPQSALMPANLLTLPHFSVSPAMRRTKSPELIGIGSVPNSMSRGINLGSARPALIASLSLSIICDGVFFGAPTPHQPLAS